MKKKHYSWIFTVKLMWKSKLLKTMRLTLFAIVLSVVQIFATNAYSQQTRLSLSMKNTSIRSILGQIENQTEYYFIYNAKAIEVEKVVSIQVEDKSIPEILETIFKDTDVTYKIDKRQIALSTSIGVNISQQKLKLSGKVTDTSGQPIPGVTVVVKGTTNGTITNFDGVYTLTEVPSDGIIQFSFVGMKMQEIPVEGKTSINVSIVEETLGIDEVVVVGYGSLSKGDLTGSVVSVNAEKLESTINTDVLSTIQDVIPGLTVEPSTFQPGSTAAIRIRGENSLSASNSPLIVVDGIPFGGSLNEINPLDIESISVLKDASSSAIYGARAANGVILIETKSGEKGKTKVTYSGNYGIQTLQHKLDLLDGEQFIDYRQHFLEWYYNQEPNQDPLEWLNAFEIPQYEAGITYDWQDILYRAAPQQEHIVSLSGANDKTNYYTSFGVLNQQGIAEKSSFKRFTLRSNVEHNLNNWLKLGYNLQLTYNDYGDVAASSLYMLGTSPYGKLKEDNGLYTINPMYPENWWRNPLANDLSTRSSIKKASNLNAFIEISPSYIPGLSYRLNMGSYLYNSDSNSFSPALNREEGSSDASASKSHSTGNRWTIENILTYKKKFGSHNLLFTGLFSREGSVSESSYLGGRKFISNGNLWDLMESAEIISISSDRTETSLESLMARLNYDFDKRYFLTLTARRDGYSGFGANNKYAFFPSAAFGWTISNEYFFKNSSILRSINFLKLRLSYGVNGNMAISPYQTLDSFTVKSTTFGDNQDPVNALVNSTIGNPDLKWEGTASYNLGLDFNLFENRLSGNVDVYKSNSKDLLMERKVPIMNGYSDIYYNIGEVENKGIELSLNSVNVKKGDFKWSSSLTFSLNRDKIVALTEEGDNITNRWFIGKPLRVYYDYNIVGIFQDEEEIANSALPNAKPGFPILEDVNDDGVITTDDRKIIGSPRPKWHAGLSNTITYKSWSLSVFINTVQGTLKSNWLINPQSWYIYKGGNYLDIPFGTMDNPSKKYILPGYDSNEFYGLSHGVYQDASYIRIKDVTLSYKLPERITESLKLNDIMFTLSGKNLYTFTDWIGYDPEVTSTEPYPSARLISIGIKVDF